MLFYQVILISVIVALIRGGKIQRLADINIQRFWLVFVPAGLTFAGVMIRNHSSESVWVPATIWLNMLVNVAFLAFFWFNRKLSGMKWFLGGWALNIAAIVANAGKMPVSQWAATMVGAGKVEANMVQHALLTSHTKLSFLADIIPAPAPPLITPQVASIGDLLMVVGLFVLVQATMCSPKDKWRPTVLIGTIALIGAGLRMWGLHWGLPNALHNYSYHPDEAFQLGAMAVLNPFRMAFDPNFYNYPSGYMNLGSVVMRVLEAWGLAKTDADAFLIARMVTMVLGAATIPLVYAAGRRLYNETAGILAAVIFAIMPLHIIHSHFATVDVPSAFWVAAALVGASIIVTKPTLKWCLLAGLFAGLAAGTKYNAALVIIPVIVAHIVCESDQSILRKLLSKGFWASIAGFVAGFIVATPGILVCYDAYRKGFDKERTHVATGHGMVFVAKGPGWLDVLTSGFGYGLGVVLLVMTLSAVACAVARRKRADWVLLSYIIPSFLLVAFSEVRFARYIIPMLPAVAILLGRVFEETHSILVEQRVVIMRYVWIALCIGVIGYTTVYALAFDRLFTVTDPRTQAAQWFEKNVPSNTTVAMPTVQWFYSVPLSKGAVQALSVPERYDLMNKSRYRLLTNSEVEWDKSVLTSSKPEYVVISDFEAKDPLRLGDRPAVSYFDELGKSYRRIAQFSSRFYAMGIDFGPTEQLPHDLKYMSPTITVYRRK